MVRKLGVSIILLILSTAYTVAGGDSNYNEYNHRMARISYIHNQLTFAHGDEEWTAASINTPLQPGDRLYAPAQSRAEIQFDDGSVLRIGNNTEAAFTRLDDDHIQIRLSVGIATLRVNSSLYFEVNTPSAAITANEKGVYRIEVQENGGVDVKVRKGRATVYNQALEKHIRKGEHIIIYNRDGADFEVAHLGRKDEWDEWNERRDAVQASRASARYLPDVAYMGAYDLDSYGRWASVGGYGHCWIPSVARGWSPYRTGRWVYRPFWGWTWVSYEPWGWLPYHYGRWFYDASYGWAWYPGPRHGFYFWSPGLVRFSYGPDWVGWCPLGPRDYVSFNLFFGRSYYRSYATHLSFGFGGSPYGYNNLYNYRAPNSVVYVNHQTFINNNVTNVYNNHNTYAGNRRVTYNTVQLPANAFNQGTIIKDHQLPLKPTVASFSPNPTATVKAPKPEFVNKPVFISPSRPQGRAIRSQDAAAGGLTVRPVENSARGTGLPQSVTSKGVEAKPGGRDVRPLAPAPETSKGFQAGGPVAPQPAGAEPAGRPTNVRPAERMAQPPGKDVSPANPAPTARPARPEEAPWPTAPPRSVNRPSTPAPSAPNITAPPARRADRPSAAPASPAPAVKSDRPDPSSWPTAPARPADRPSRPSYNAPSPNPPPARGGERPSVAPTPPREERRQKPAVRDNSYYSPPPPHRDVVPAPPRSHSVAPAPVAAPAPNWPAGEGWRRVEPMPSPSAPRYNPPPAHSQPMPSPSAPPRYNPPPMHSSPAPARPAPSPEHGGYGRSPQPSYSAPPAPSSPPPSHDRGMGRSIGAAPAGGHAEPGGRRVERQSIHQ